MHRLILFLLITSSALTTTLLAQTVPPDNDFYNPTFRNETASYSSPGTADDTNDFNTVLSELSGRGGGTVNIAAGTYNFLGVQLQSNVHLRFDAGATINPAAGTDRDIFEANNDASPLTNFSIQGVGGKFIIDYRSVGTDTRMRAINFRNANNFSISNFHVLDSESVFSALSFGTNAVFGTNSTDGLPNITPIRGVPHSGIIENLSISKADFGYGLVQVQAGNNLLFRDLEAEGGATLRLETGFDRNQFVDRVGGLPNEQAQAIALDQIYGRNLSSLNGQSAVVLSPHTLDHGVVDLRGITAVSSETGVKVAQGFVAGDADGPSNQELAALTPGSFGSASVVRDVTVTFGQNAQLHPSKNLRYLPNELREARTNGVGISATSDRHRIGPSTAAVLAVVDNPEVDYEVDFPIEELTAIGFNVDDYHLPPKAYYRDAFDDFEPGEAKIGVLDSAGETISFFVPRELRDTPNRQLAASDVLLGDCNLDGVVNFLDIAPLIGFLTSGTYLDQADCNQDGVVNFLDIAPFIEILTN